MRLPFTRDQFLAVFQSYHEAIGLAPLVLMLVAVGLVVMARSDMPQRRVVVAAGLCALWLWSGVVYHWGFFSRINPAARVFGAVFVVQAFLFLALGRHGDDLAFKARDGRRVIVGWLLIGYAIVIYPLLGFLTGHGYPNGPSFGAPCPVTIYSIGILFWIRDRIPITLAAIPIGWAVVGTVAAPQLGIREDLGLPVAAALLVAALIRERVTPHQRLATFPAPR